MQLLRKLLVWALVIGLFVWFILRVTAEVEKITAETDLMGTRQAAETRAPILFLQGIDFDHGPVVVVIEPGASDTGPLVVRDQVVLRAHRETALLADTGADERATIIGAMFGQPRSAAIRIWQNGRRMTEHNCFAPQCAQDPVTQESLAPLIAAGERFARHDLSFDDYGAYLAARAETDPNRFTPLYSVESHNPRPNSVKLDLPAGIITAQSEADTHAMLQWGEASSNTVADWLDAAPGGEPAPRGDANISPALFSQPVMMQDTCLDRSLGYIEGVEAVSVTLEMDLDDAALARVQGADWSFLLPPPMPLADPVAVGGAAFPNVRPGCLGFAADLPNAPHLGDAHRSQYRLTYEAVLP